MTAAEGKKVTREQKAFFQPYLDEPVGGVGDHFREFVAALERETGHDLGLGVHA